MLKCELEIVLMLEVVERLLNIAGLFKFKF